MKGWNILECIRQVALHYIYLELKVLAIFIIWSHKSQLSSLFRPEEEDSHYTKDLHALNKFLKQYLNHIILKKLLFEIFLFKYFILGICNAKYSMP